MSRMIVNNVIIGSASRPATHRQGFLAEIPFIFAWAKDM